MNRLGRPRRSAFTQWLCLQAFPELRRWPVTEWQGRLAQARQTDFDRSEYLIALFGLGFFAWQLKPIAALGIESFLIYLQEVLSFSLLLAVLVAPLLIRRLRRGLRVLAG